MDLSYRIASAERDLKKNLENFFSLVFGTTNLASHGLDHHRRVWKYAKGLIQIPEISGSANDETLPEKLLIASYIHDLGMSVDSGPKHGAVSSHLCEEFLRTYNMPLNDYKDVIYAILNHDNKDYSPILHSSKLLSILSVADDMDAFGFIGIYRYLEIYLIRKIPFDLLGYRIQENVTSRFVNLSKNYSFLLSFSDEQRLRFETVNTFFTNFNRQLESEGFGSGNHEPSGYCGVAKLIEIGISENLTLTELFELAGGYSSDKDISLFFSGLKKELSDS